MNQDNKISSVRPRTINVELGLNLCVIILAYRGIRSVDDIYRLQSAHTENYREPGVHCNKKGHQIMPFIFTGPKNSGCIFLKMLQLLGDSVP